MAVFPDPLFLRDCGSDLFCSSAGRSHRALAGCRPRPGTFARRAAANARRLLLGTSLPQKKFTRLCSSSISGIMANHNTHLAPGFTPSDLVPAPVNVAVLSGTLGPLPLGESHSLYQVSSQQGNWLSPCGPKTSRLHLATGDSSFSPEHHQVLSVEFQTLQSPSL